MGEQAHDYTLTRDQLTMLAALVHFPADMRREHLIAFSKSHGHDFIIDAFAAFIGLANSVHKNTVEFAETELMARTNTHPHELEQWNWPTIFGAILGTGIANDAKGRCDGCAFRAGSHASQCVSTVSDAKMCADEGERFLCHEDEEPHRACRGWAAAAKRP